MDATGAWSIVLAGTLLVAGLFAWCARRARATTTTVTRLVDLALGGRADEARIQARNASAELGPVLDALGGELAPPRRRPYWRDAVAAALTPLPLVILSVFAFTGLRSAGPDRVELASAVLIALGILLPICAAGAFAIIAVARHTDRSMRGSCVTLLARNVKGAVDAEVADALRRGANLRDPRGD